MSTTIQRKEVMNNGTRRRSYEESHPWISFELDLRNVSYETWMLLGQIQAKCEQIAEAQLPPELADELSKVNLAKGVHGTTAIEGNTLSEEYIRQRIDGNAPELPLSIAYQGSEVDNIIAACN